MALFKVVTKDDTLYYTANSMADILLQYEPQFVIGIEYLADQIVAINSNAPIVTAPSELVFTFCRINKLSVDELQDISKAKHLAEGRRAICYLLETELNCSLNRIASLICKDHTSVIHYKASMANQLKHKQGLAYDYVMNYYKATAE